MWYQEDCRVGDIIESLEPYRITEKAIIEVGRRWTVSVKWETRQVRERVWH